MVYLLVFSIKENDSKLFSLEISRMNHVSETTYDQFHTVFEEYYNSLCNYAFNYVKELSSSEDIVQEVFVRIWEKRQDIIASETLRFYLFTAVRNNCLTHLQKEKKAAIVELNDYDAAEEQKTFSEEMKPETDYKAQLTSAMDQLPPKCREVFVLSRISKQSYKEIATTLDISVKTVENQMGKALKVIRGFLKENNVFLWMLMGIINLFK